MRIIGNHLALEFLIGQFVHVGITQVGMQGHRNRFDDDLRPNAGVTLFWERKPRRARFQVTLRSSPQRAGHFARCRAVYRAGPSLVPSHCGRTPQPVRNCTMALDVAGRPVLILEIVFCDTPERSRELLLAEFGVFPCPFSRSPNVTNVLPQEMGSNSVRSCINISGEEASLGI